MMCARIHVGTLFLTVAGALACSSTDVGDRASADAGVEASQPLSPPSAPTDAGAPDAARSDIEPASRLDVTCAGNPCYVAVSGAGGEHVCGVLKDGSVRCWGRDSRSPTEVPADGGAPRGDGALGRGRAISSIEGATPAPVVGLSGVTQISVGRNLGTCARTTDGSVYCWGRNERGQLGQPAAEARIAVPTRIEGLPPVSSVALGGSTGCAVASSGGALWCWGARHSRIGRAAAPGDAPSFPPQVMSAFRPPVREVVIGTAPRDRDTPFEDTIVALLDGGVLASLGEHPAGHSSVPAGDSAELPPVPFELNGVLRAGAFAYLANSGLLSQWLPQDELIYVPLPHTAVDTSIVTGVHNEPYIEQAGVLLSNGRLFRWGRNTAGVLGYPSRTLAVATNPHDMSHVVGDRVVSFAMAKASTCVSLVDGKVECWGSNEHGELGRGTVDVAEHTEAEVIR